MQPHWCKRHASASMPCGFASAHKIGKPPWRTGKFLEGRARLRPGHCGRYKARPPDLRLSTFDFPGFPMPRNGLPNLPGDGHGRCDKGRRHMGLASMWRRTWRGMRDAHPRQFPKIRRGSASCGMPSPPVGMRANGFGHAVLTSPCRNCRILQASRRLCGCQRFVTPLRYGCEK